MNHQKVVARQRTRRQFRVRGRILGTAERPRLCVFRSHKHLYVQIVDDLEGRTLASASTRDKALCDEGGRGSNKSAAQAVGKAIAERAKAAGVDKVAFDRREYKYHGRVAALADAAREAGLSF